MKDSIRRRLERLADRCDEVGRLLAEPDAASRTDRFRELSVEYARLEPVAAAFRAWLDLERQLKSARDMASDPDPGVRELAAVEVEQLTRRMADEEAALQWALVPPDPQDEQTFQRFKLNHDLKHTGRHRMLRDYYQRLIELRKSEPPLAFPARQRLDISVLAPARALLRCPRPPRH